MIRNKKLTMIILVILILTFASGCSDKTETSAEENIGATELDIQVSKDEVAEVEDVEEEEGEEEVYSGNMKGMEWPRELMDGIPQPPGRITNVSTPLYFRHIDIESVKEKDALNFVDELKSLGFTQEPEEMLRDTFLVYIADHEDGRRVSFHWKRDEKTLQFIYEALDNR